MKPLVNKTTFVVNEISFRLYIETKLKENWIKKMKNNIVLRFNL